MAIVEHRWSQTLPASLDETWRFFSDPRNLARMTPPEMHFRVLSELPDEMAEGLIIRYRVSPLFGIPLTWVTEITQVEKPLFFVDEQRRGPYRYWRHGHRFEAVDGGVRVDDLLRYELPFPGIRRLVHPLIVRPRIEAIFAFRRKSLASIRWGGSPGT